MARVTTATMIAASSLLTVTAAAQPPPAPQPQPPPPQPQPAPAPQPPAPQPQPPSSYPQPAYPYPQAYPPRPYPQPYAPRYPYGSPPRPGGQYPYGYPGFPASPEEESASGETRNDVHALDWMTFTIGLTGGLGVNALGKPKLQSVGGRSFTPDYPGFVGLNAVIGAQLEVRFLGYVGLEVDLLYASENGSTEIEVFDQATGDTTTFTMSIGHGALHVPILLKAAIPGEVATPIFLLGPEIVRTGEPRFELTGPNETGVDYGSYTRHYTMVAFGLGLEINLPTKGVDLRIPLTLRGGYNPSVGDSRDERVRAFPRTGDLTRESYDTAWQWTIRAQTGLSVNF